MLASGNAWVAEIAKLPGLMASKLFISINFADIASNAPPTLSMAFLFKISCSKSEFSNVFLQ